MSQQYGPYYRIGEPGGPGCAVTALTITMESKDGIELPAKLLDAGPHATEVELLRTIASGLGIRWGHDDLGWWATVPSYQITGNAPQ